MSAQMTQTNVPNSTNTLDEVIYLLAQVVRATVCYTRLAKNEVRAIDLTSDISSVFILKNNR